MSDLGGCWSRTTTGGSCQRITNSSTYGRAAGKNVRNTFVARCATWTTMRGSLKYSTTTKAAQRTTARTTPPLKWARATRPRLEDSEEETTTAPQHAQRATLQWRATQEKMLWNDLTSSLSALHVHQPAGHLMGFRPRPQPALPKPKVAELQPRSSASIPQVQALATPPPLSVSR
jgi:hypothetical protein